MTRLTANEVRRQFVDYFVKKCGHTFVPSSPCVPADDPTLMFTNAGMNQFKDVFLATGTRPYSRATNSQKCIRAGGKHNDLDDVGHDTYHHTFFEMLGNWSFGDYFKKEAIAWAWDLLTRVWGLDKSRLHATYFEGDDAEGLDADTEAAELWKTVTDIDPTHIHPGSKKDNFWEMGETGPCGPCSEIHIDLTPDKSGAALVNAGDPRVIEIWNLVFIQFNRAADGKLSALPARHVDTGMGFERITAVLQKVNGNYDTDLFTPIFAAIHEVTGAPAYEGRLESDLPQAGAPSQPPDAPAQQTDAPAQQTGAPAQQAGASAQQTDASTQRAGVSSRPAPPGAEDGPAHRVAARADVMRDVAYRVVADHIRCLVFAIADGAVPANEGRGYVLRRILRRAVRYGRQYLRLHARSCNEDEPRASARADNQTPSRPRTASGHTSAAEPFLHKLVPIVVDTMAGAFPELKREAERVAEIIRDEEASFGKTLDRGIKLFEEAAQFAINHHRGRISGEDAFKLHDTYGFPIDLTELMAEERNLTVDIGEYERLMEAARERARQGTSTEAISKLLSIPQRYLTEETRDDYKYTQLSTQSRFLFATGSSPDTGTPPISSIGQMGWVFDTTCFYAEQGGQIGDTGLVKLASGESAKVLTTKKSGNLVIHIVAWSKVDRGPKPDEEVTLCVDAVSRLKTTQNHTATHILNWALREVLGDHVQQKGSLVDPEKTRFDLSHPSQITDEELARIESLVNEKIAADLPVYAKEVPQADALKINGLRAVFGEKYPDRVRVVSIGAQIGEPGVADPNTLLGDPDNPKWRQYSVEFCGGTHLGRTGEAGRFRLIEESAVAKGIRRVVGVTGERAEQAEAAATALARQLKEAAAADDAALPRRIAEITALMTRAELPVVEKLRLRTDLDHLQAKARRIQKQADKQGAADVLARTATLLEDAEQINGCAVISAALGRVTVDQLRAASDSLRQRAGSAAVFLAGESAGKVVLLAAMTPDVVKRGIKAGDLIKAVAPMVGGKGGGRPDMAQGGGTDISRMDEAAHTAGRWLREKLAAS